MNETSQVFIINGEMSQPSTSTAKSIELPETPQVNLENVKDFSNVCRICATITNFFIPIFTGEGLQNNLAEKIHTHLPIKVTENDVLPRVLCYQCASTLLAWHELVACCRHADVVLRARIDADPHCTEQEPTPTDSKTCETLDEDAIKFKNKECIPLSVKPTILPTSPIRVPNPSSTPLQSMTLPIRPLALLAKSAAPPVQVVNPLVQTSTPQTYVISPPAPIITPSIQPATTPVQPITSQSPSTASPTSRQPPKYASPQRKCDYCNTIYPEDKYSEHMIMNHSEIVFFCEECNRFVSKTVLVIHMSLHAYGYIPKTESKSKTKICRNNDNQDSNQYVAPEKAQSDGPPIIQNNKNQKNMNTENEFSDHSDIDNGFDPIPESVFEAIEDSQDTQPSETDQATVIEHQSGESNGSIPQTEKDTKKSRKKKTRTCPVCSRKFTASSSFFYHMRFTHKRIKEHECDVCSRKFATRASLTSHSTTHTGERQFECKVCKKYFGSKASLYIHEQIHNGVKKWSCSQCHVSFRWKTHLARHMKRHSAEKVHLCATCGRGFSVRCDLLRHVRTHTAGNFACGECSLVFAQLRYLKAHMNKKHSGKCDKNS